MHHSSPSSSSAPLSPTSTTPSSVPPPTLTTRGSSALLNIARRSSGKRISEALTSAKTAMIGLPNRISTIPSPQSPPTSPSKSYAGPLSRLREHITYVTRPARRSSSPPPKRQQASLLAKVSGNWKPQKNECRCLQYVLPGIFLAFEDDTLTFGASLCVSLSREEELRTHDGERFTHIVKLTPSAESSIQLGSTLRNTEILTLGIPRHSHAGFDERMRLLSKTNLDELTPEVAHRLCEEYAALQEPEQGITVLTLKQLIVTREFMFATKYDIRERQGPRILITAPRDHSTDIISVLALYLAYVTRNTVALVLHQIDNHEYFWGFWKNTVSKEGLDLIQYIVDL
ncbi:hypothetical protein D9757_001716 [Collybiopsis confluens]|uniref:Uncharacterized protein n=1 Tax=Collybiopsis confluens TaxID=2823264 RepID=A0A8H5HY84_9AGAR|nr:hypothetical protein D9757_001716 [Collybiopsis confluens]